jgi:hypothetical protein
VSAGVAAGVSICVVSDGKELATIAVAGLGGGAGTDFNIGGSASVTGGPLTSNATDIDDILGFSVCGGGSGGDVISAAGEVCLGLTDHSGARTGIWTGYAGVGVGVGADGHIYETHTWELFRIPMNPVCFVSDC